MCLETFWFRGTPRKQSVVWCTLFSVIIWNAIFASNDRIGTEIICDGSTKSILRWGLVNVPLFQLLIQMNDGSGRDIIDDESTH